eukprot:jgi/Picre1/32396/NNA_007742.t1
MRIDSRRLFEGRHVCSRAGGQEGGDSVVVLQHSVLERERALKTGRMVKVAHILLQNEGDVGRVMGDIAGIRVGDLSSVFGDLAREYSACPSGKNGESWGGFLWGRWLESLRMPDEKMQGEIKPMSVEELSELLTCERTADGQLELDTVQLIDVREPSEIDIAKLPGFWKVFSLSAFGEWGPNAEYLLDPDKTTIVLCHHGIRSAQVCQFLLKKNFNDLRNVTGGINAYCKIDPSIPEY